MASSIHYLFCMWMILQIAELFVENYVIIVLSDQTFFTWWMIK